MWHDVKPGYLTVLILGAAFLYMFNASLKFDHAHKTALALSVPIEQLNTVPGEITKITDGYGIDKFTYQFSYNGKVMTETKSERWLSAWRLKTGPANIIVDDTGRYSMPEMLMEKIPHFRKFTKSYRDRANLISMILFCVLIYYSILTFRIDTFSPSFKWAEQGLKVK